MRNILFKNPIMERIEKLSGGQKGGILAGVFLLSAFTSVASRFASVEIENPVVMVLLMLFGLGISNLTVYLILGFQVNWKAKTRNLMANLCSVVTVIVLAAVLIFSAVASASSAGEPKLIMESSPYDESCTVKVYRTNFDFLKGQDADIYFEMNNGEGEERLIAQLYEEHEIKLIWLDNRNFRINNQRYTVRDGTACLVS